MCCGAAFQDGGRRLVWTLVARLLDSREWERTRVGGAVRLELQRAAAARFGSDESFRLFGEQARGVEPLFWKKTGQESFGQTDT